MDDKKQQTTFGDLPQSLVKELLEKSEDVGKALSASFIKIHKNKENLKQDLKNAGVLKKENDYRVITPPTTCGVDGAYAKEELLSVDLLACAAVALEGLTPPSETRYWEEPHHLVYINEEEHNPETNTILRAIMIGMEQILAERAPHDVVFLDGSLTTPLIFFNQAITKIAETDKSHQMAVSKKLIEILPDALTSYRKILGNSRGDKLWVGMPKYTTKRELGEKMKWDRSYDDRALLTLLLSPGELVDPMSIEKPSEPWHLTYDHKKQDVEAIKTSLENLKVMYYKPCEWTPALRIEITSTAAVNDFQLGMILQAIKFQCSTPGIFEPFPLFLSDRMVKSLGVGLPTFRQVVTKKMAEDFDGDIGEVFFSMHGYRTEKSK